MIMKTTFTSRISRKTVFYKNFSFGKDPHTYLNFKKKYDHISFQIE